jgi:gluconolactonase
MPIAVFLFAGILAVLGRPSDDIGTAGELRKLFDGFKFTEGPAPDRAGNLYFSDTQGNRIYRLDSKGELSIFLEDTKYSNGLMVDRGRLLVAQRDLGRILSVDLKTKAITVVVDRFEDRPFIGPNDLVVDRAGGVYFSDPRFPTSPTDRQEKEGVYYVDTHGKITRLVADRPRPNGVLLSPDEKTLYVLFSGRTDVMAYPVLSPGRIGEGRTLCELQQVPGTTAPRGGDGLAVAEDGTLYIAQPDLEALQVVTAAGQTLGLIKLPGRPTNAEFGGRDMKTLFITLHTRNAAGQVQGAFLYAIAMKKKGHRFGRK